MRPASPGGRASSRIEKMRSITVATVLGLAAVIGCGSSTSTSSFTSCEIVTSECIAGDCSIVEECFVDECESKIEYEFEGEEYRSRCTFGPVSTTTIYPLEGGAGTARIVRDVRECFYKAEVDFNDFTQTGQCTNVEDCTVQQLSCGPSQVGDPNAPSLRRRLEGSRNRDDAMALGRLGLLATLGAACSDTDRELVPPATSLPYGIEALTDLTTIAELRPPGLRVEQVSSYDRTGGNADLGVGPDTADLLALLNIPPLELDNSYLYHDGDRYVIFD
jgi:hypothetical protein